ncbi:MAG: GtrA family protein [Wenzhouxiangellaceae bacterium]|nr:GtrA family protein [Wenzhouxiangellaceae bacterium]
MRDRPSRAIQCTGAGKIPVKTSLRLLKRGVRSHSSRATFFRFACVGGTIALIDAGLLYLLKDLPGFNVYIARVVSYTAAMSTGYVLNRYFTFHHLDSRHVMWNELLRFLSVHSVGGLINFGVFTLVVIAAEHLELSDFQAAVVPLLGVWIGGLVGMAFNFALARRIVFNE